MTITIDNAIVRISSRNPEITDFGTAFIIGHDATAAYLVTCAHVVKAVGGPEQVCIGKLPAAVVAMDAENGIDVAVVRVEGLLDRGALGLQLSTDEGTPVHILGYSRLAAGRAKRRLHGVLGESFEMDNVDQTLLVEAWDILIDSHADLDHGYSGSPVIDDRTGKVVGMAIYKAGEKRGTVISSAAIPAIWANRPPDLLAVASDEDGSGAVEPDDSLKSLTEASIDLFTYSDPGHQPPAPVVLDWVDTFNPQLHGDEQWRTLLAGLDDLQRSLRKQGVRSVKVRPANTHLSAGYALGYAFRASTGFHVRVEQVIDRHTNQTQEWPTNEVLAPAPVIMVAPSLDQLGSWKGDTTLEVSISRDITSYVDTWLDQSSASIHKRIKVQPSGGPGRAAIPDAATAAAMTEQIWQVIDRIRRPGKTIHLLSAVPIGLAVLIGTRLNRSGPIQCYELVNDSYEASCLLRA